MNKRFNFTTLSILVLIIVIIGVTTSLLACLNSRYDCVITNRYATMTNSWANLNNKGQRWLNENCNNNDGYYESVIEDESNHSLNIKIRVINNKVEIIEWKYNTIWYEDEKINVWRP